MTTKSKYVKLTKKAVEDMFDECNVLYFNNEVEKPKKFETWTPSKRTLGLTRPLWESKKRRWVAALHISRRYNWTEENLRHVVVHEMIHMLIRDYAEPLTFWQRLPFIGRWFLTEHDQRFIDKMNEINDKFGLNIKVRFPEMRAEFKG